MPSTGFSLGTKPTGMEYGTRSENNVRAAPNVTRPDQEVLAWQGQVGSEMNVEISGFPVLTVEIGLPRSPVKSGRRRCFGRRVGFFRYSCSCLLRAADSRALRIVT